MSDPDQAEAILRDCVQRAREAPATVRELCKGLPEADTRRKPSVGKLSIVEHACHLVDMERQVFGVRLQQILEEDDPVLDPLNIEEHAVEAARLEGHTLDALLDAWQAARLENAARVECTHSSDWERTATHPQLGRATFLDVVKRWARHDDEHVRQIEILALNSRERNLQ